MRNVMLGFGVRLANMQIGYSIKNKWPTANRVGDSQIHRDGLCRFRLNKENYTLKMERNSSGVKTGILSPE
jgi:hypothetical protein